jgi:hypothetical protein
MRFPKIFLLSTLFLSGALPVLADFGNRFVAHHRLSTVLDSSDKKISYRFTCQEDMDLAAASVFCLKAENPPAYLLSLQADDQGRPSGTALASSHFIPRPQSWVTLPLSRVPLLKGKVYHLVVEQDALRGGGHPVGVIGPSNCASFLSTDTLNHLHCADGTPDPKTNTLLFEGGHWRELNQEPIYALYGAGNSLQGNPYDDPGERPIYGGTPGDKSAQVLQGEALHFHCGYAATAFAVRVRKQGNPTSPLNYSILKNFFQIHKTASIYTAVALNPDQVSPDFKWVTVGFGDRSKSNFSPECWYLVFQTDSGRASKDSPGCDDCYVISDVGNSGGLAQAAEFSFDGGPHLSRLVYSLDGGSPSHWLDEFERDANVVVIGPDCPAPENRNDEPIPTPEPLMGQGGFLK